MESQSFKRVPAQTYNNKKKKKEDKTVQQLGTEEIKALIILWAAEMVQNNRNLIASYFLELPPVIAPLK